ncbi:MAG: hypothetical protein LBL80_01305 [Ruminococcus sp.]|nr:hypothetical protein [Ruminococcus sp.]
MQTISGKVYIAAMLSHRRRRSIFAPPPSPFDKYPCPVAFIALSIIYYQK